MHFGNNKCETFFHLKHIWLANYDNTVSNSDKIMKRIVAPKVFDSCLSQKYGTYSNNEVKVYAVIGDKGGKLLYVILVEHLNLNYSEKALTFDSLTREYYYHHKLKRCICINILTLVLVLQNLTSMLYIFLL